MQLRVWNVYQHSVGQHSEGSEEGGGDWLQDSLRWDVQICLQSELSRRNYRVAWLRSHSPDLRRCVVRPVLRHIPRLEGSEDPPVVLRQVQVGISGEQEGHTASHTVIKPLVFP